MSNAILIGNNIYFRDKMVCVEVFENSEADLYNDAEDEDELEPNEWRVYVHTVDDSRFHETVTPVEYQTFARALINGEE